MKNRLCDNNFIFFDFRKIITSKFEKFSLSKETIAKHNKNPIVFESI